MAKKAQKRASAKRSRPAGKRDLVRRPKASAYAKRTARGRFKEMDDVGRSQKADKARKAKKKVRSGYGDQGDERPAGLAADATVDMPRKSPARRVRSTSLDRLAPFEDDCVLVVIETPKGSPNKLTFEPRYGTFVLKGVLPAGAVFPFDFGFVPSTRADDGDPLMSSS